MTARRPPRPPEVPPYVRSAAIYDRVYAWKDYAKEARRVRALVRRYGPKDARALLDVGCGTGEHLRHLARWFAVTGVDPNPAMLAVARRKLPRARFVRGRMESFRLGPDRFDALTCLFSAIGYVRSARALERAVRNFAWHLRPGGVVLIEPWLTPTMYRPGGVHVQSYGTPDSPIVRMNTEAQRGDRSILDMHYLVGEHGRVYHWVERHDLGLFDSATMRRAFRRAGLEVLRIPSGFTTHRGLYVGKKRLSQGLRRTPRGRRNPGAQQRREGTLPGPPSTTPRRKEGVVTGGRRAGPRGT